MREKYLWLAVMVLTVLTLGQACYIYECSLSAKEISGEVPVRPEIAQKAYAEKALEAQEEEFEKWRDRIKWQVYRGDPLGERDFDVFFNDRYFSGRGDPFGEMERIHRQLSDLFPGPEKTLFDDYWDRWFEQRMRMAQFTTQIIRTGEDVTLSVTVPGLAGGTAAVDITGDRIKIAFRAASSSEEKTSNGLIRSGQAQDYLKILPVPEEADAATGKVEIRGERVKITFALKKNRR
jgi:HSP20 family molecular chaperone IbpA